MAADKSELYEQAAQSLVRAGVDVNKRCNNGHTLLRDICFKGFPEIAEICLRASGNVDEAIESLFHEACASGREDVVEMLMRLGARVNGPTLVGWTALHSACKTDEAGVVQILLDAGANVHAVDIGGRTPLHVVCENDSDGSIELLLAAGAGTDIHKADDDGMTPYILARKTGCKYLAEKMLEGGGKK